MLSLLHIHGQSQVLTVCLTCVQAKANRPFARALREHSFLYRLFYYLLY